MPLCNLVSTGLNLLLFVGGVIPPLPKGPEKITAQGILMSMAIVYLFNYP